MQTATTSPALVALPKKKQPLQLMRWYFREVCVVAIWLYVLTKIFVLDIDTKVAAAAFPSLLPLLSYRFFFFLLAFALLWIALGSRALAKLLAYAALYPFIVVLCRAPKILIRHWPVLLAFSPAICSRILGLKRSLVYFAVVAISALTIVTLNDVYFLVPAMTILGLYLLRHYYSRFRAAFRPATVFADVASLIRRSSRSIREAAVDTKVDKKSKPKPEEERKREAMLTVYAYISALEYLSIKFREVAASRKFELYLILSLVYSMFFTIVIFAFEFYAIETLLPGSFTPSDQVSFWSLLSFSSSALAPAQVGEMRAVGVLAQVVSHIQFYAAAFLSLVLVYVMLTINKERYNDDLDRVINELSTTADDMRADTEARFRMKVDELEIYLLAFNGKVINTLRTLRGLEALSITSAAKETDSSDLNVRNLILLF